jgi:MutS domain V/MutS domain III
MEPGDYYEQRLITLRNELAVLNKKKALFGWLRFAAIIGIIANWLFVNPFSLLFAIVITVLLVVLFTRLVLSDLANKAGIEQLRLLISINEDELKFLQHHYQFHADGLESLPRDHHYANDLDLFGHASLYQYLNRTTSEPGNNTLAGWLLNPATSQTIAARQAAVKELSVDTVWRQKLQALGKIKKIRLETKERLRSWFEEDDRFIHVKTWQILRFLVPSVLVIVIALNIGDIIGSHARNYCLLASALLAFYISKKVTPIHQQVSKMSEELEVLADSIQLVEQASFSSPYLQQLQEQFNQEHQKASARLNALKRILERLDLRFNFVVFIPLDILLQWDLQQAIALEKWKKHNHRHVLSWFAALGEFEAVSSLATLSFNHPGWAYPVIKDEYFYIKGKEIAHPLIPSSRRVSNFVSIENSGEIMLVTGSNMAGKSTYLRSIGINVVLAMAGGPVCAKELSLSPVQLISSMRIADNLEESTSTFYAELKKLKTVIEKVNRKEPVFILLDEILRGTNSLDRHTGSLALIKQLIKHKAPAIIATHDVELAKIKQEYPGNILNYHFDVQVSNDELYFDYKLKEGICSSLNASILMKKIGIEL